MRSTQRHSFSRLAAASPRTLAFVFIAAIAIVHSSPVLAADALRLHLYWQHQAQFAGYYVAAARGYYEREGLHVTFVESGAGIQPLERLASGQAEISIGWLAHALQARERGADLVNVAQVFQKSGMALACRRSGGIGRSADLPGHRVGVWNVGDEINVRLWMKRAGMNPDSITTVGQAADGDDLIRGRVACATVMTYNEYWKLIDGGIKPADLFVVRFGDASLGLLEDGLYVRSERLRDPAFRSAIARFLRASADGWRYAREQRGEALRLVLAQRRGLDPLHQRRMLDAVLGLIPAQKSGAPFGRLDPEQFRRTVEALAEDPAHGDRARQAASDSWTHDLLDEAGLIIKKNSLQRDKRAF